MPASSMAARITRARRPVCMCGTPCISTTPIRFTAEPTASIRPEAGRTRCAATPRPARRSSRRLRAPAATTTTARTATRSPSAAAAFTATRPTNTEETRDMRKLLVFAAFAAMLAVDAAAWNLVPCSAQSIAKRAEYQHRLAGAPSGSLNWIPYPFPHNDAQAIEDFRHQYLDIWGHKQATDTARRHFVDSLSANTLKFDVYRVENWRSNRCDSPMNGDFFFLLRMRDGATGQEIARADLYDSGVFASIAIAPADLPRATIDAHINQHEIADPAVVANRNAARQVGR